MCIQDINVRHIMLEFLDVEPCPELGDVNDDSSWNVLDIVQLSNCILSNNCDEQVNGSAGDFNSDGFWNVLDIVQLVNLILSS